MASTKYTGDRATKWIRWIARIWGTVIIGYALILLICYAVNWVTIGTADPHAVEGYPPIENLPPLLMFLSILGLGIAWRWEGLGGAINIVFCLATLPLLLLIRWPITLDLRFVGPYLILMIIVTPGILFLVCWWRSRKRRIPQNSA